MVAKAPEETKRTPSRAHVLTTALGPCYARHGKHHLDILNHKKVRIDYLNDELSRNSVNHMTTESRKKYLLDAETVDESTYVFNTHVWQTVHRR